MDVRRRVCYTVVRRRVFASLVWTSFSLNLTSMQNNKIVTRLCYCELYVFARLVHKDNVKHILYQFSKGQDLCQMIQYLSILDAVLHCTAVRPEYIY